MTKPDADDHSPHTTIRLHKHVRATKQRVFEALTTADQYPHWFAPGADAQCSGVVLEPRVGGQFKISMGPISGEGHTMNVSGTVTVFDPHDKLVYTMAWDENPEFAGDTVVTYELFDAPNPYDDDGTPGTEIVLTHERIHSAIERSQNTGGWWNALRALGYYVRGVDPREAMYGQTAKSSS